MHDGNDFLRNFRKDKINFTIVKKKRIGDGIDFEKGAKNQILLLNLTFLL